MKLQRKHYLFLTALIGGISMMGTQIAVSRLLAPYFGTSLPVWTGVLSLIMIALGIGYYVGGRITDQQTQETTFHRLVLATGIYLGLIPFIFIPLTKLAAYGIEQVETTYHISSLIIALSLMVLLLILPFIALGMFTPYLIQLNLQEQPQKPISMVAGPILSCLAVGNIIGSILSNTLIIPTIGTSRSIFIFATLLMLVSIVTLRKWVLLLLPIGTIISTSFLFQIKPEKDLIFETESMYNYIQVFNIGGVNTLRLNEGHAEHSLYQKDEYLVGGVWDYYLLLGLINHGKNALSIGLGGGTFARQYTYFIPGSQVDGVDIDPAIIEVGKRYFSLGDVPGLQSFATDGRLYLQTTPKIYDSILIDAYKQPYIPFQLTTKEFFQAIQRHLGNNGIVGINVGSTDPHSPVLLKIENTMKSVFKHVYRLYMRRSLNYFVWATDYDFDYDSIQLAPHQEVLRPIVQYMQQRAQEINYNPHEVVLTDNRAPLELSTEKMILDFALGFKE